MQLFNRIISLLLLFSVSSLATAGLEQQRQQFLEAEKALNNNDHKTFQALKKQLGDYPLTVYLDYFELTGNLAKQSATDIRRFMTANADTPLADRLQSKWLNSLAKRKQWQTLIDFYQPDLGTRMECHYLQALLETGKKDVAMSKVSQIWLHGRSLPKACDPVFKQWQNAGLQTAALTWQRIAMALEAGEIRLARYLARSLPEKDKPDFDLWLEVRRNPQNLKAGNVPENHPYRQEVLAQGIMKLARKDLEKALFIWQQLKNDQVDQPELIAQVERRIALELLDEPMMENFDYLVFTEPCDSDSKLQEIRIRAALLHQSWQEVITWIDRLPQDLRDDDRWHYWRARSLQELGNTTQANALFEKIAKNRSFYGFMAADILNRDYAFNNRQIDIDKQAYDEMLQLDAVRRTKELLALERNISARREWYYLSSSMEQDELLVMAKIAHDWQWHDRAIMAMASAKYWDDLSIRFPLRYKKLVYTEAHDNELDPAWIYAMMRQESAFMHDARSSVGALGLMQLMPRTARSVAKSLQQPKPDTGDILTPGKNIELGSAYLKQVYDQFNQHPVLAIASYNAGPHRVKNWLPESAEMPADIWIELVPFRETRKYLKSVLAYTVIYAEKLGIENIRMKQRMPVIPAREQQKLAANSKN